MALEQEISFYGTLYSDDCPGCSRVEPQRPGLDKVLESEYFRVHQDYELPIPGMMVIEAKRHIPSITDFTKLEQDDFIKVLNRVRGVMRAIGIDEATIVQEEKSALRWYRLSIQQIKTNFLLS